MHWYSRLTSNTDGDAGAESDVALALTACMNHSELIDIDVLVAATAYAETLTSIDRTYCLIC